MRIALIRLRSLGDTVLMTPALEALRRDGHQVGVVLERPFDGILRAHPAVERLFVLSGRKSWLSRLRAVGEIRSFRPELAIDLHGGPTSALMTRLSGAEQRVGFAASRHRRFYNRLVPNPRELWGKPRLHTVEHQLAPLLHLGFPVAAEPRLSLPVDASALEAMRDLLAAQGVEEGFILIHPAAAFDTKRWPVERFGALARLLLDKGLPAIATAGPGEETLLEEFRRLTDGRLRVIPPVPLGSFAALASLCGLYVGNDTGATHVAAAVGRPIVVIFGSSDANAWHPWGVPYELLRSDRECVPCPGYYCLHYPAPLCVRDIPVERVTEAVTRMWSRTGG